MFSKLRLTAFYSCYVDVNKDDCQWVVAFGLQQNVVYYTFESPYG